MGVPLVLGIKLVPTTAMVVWRLCKVCVLSGIGVGAGGILVSIWGTCMWTAAVVVASVLVVVLVELVVLVVLVVLLERVLLVVLLELVLVVVVLVVV